MGSGARMRHSSTALRLLSLISTTTLGGNDLSDELTDEIADPTRAAVKRRPIYYSSAPLVTARMPSMKTKPRPEIPRLVSTEKNSLQDKTALGSGSGDWENIVVGGKKLAEQLAQIIARNRSRR
ncbi:hypothetical protein C8J56DRAFT_974822 [Mycena floridula]|nr:hypothetical protein C8J56DRAFT_974822 [Mycena floridula]